MAVADVAERLPAPGRRRQPALQVGGSVQGLQVGGQLVRRESAVLGDVPGQEEGDPGAREGERVEGRDPDLGPQRQRQVPGEERIQVPPAVEQVEVGFAAIGRPASLAQVRARQRREAAVLLDVRALAFPEVVPLGEELAVRHQPAGVRGGPQVGPLVEPGLPLVERVELARADPESFHVLDLRVANSAVEFRRLLVDRLLQEQAGDDPAAEEEAAPGGLRQVALERHLLLVEEPRHLGRSGCRSGPRAARRAGRPRGGDSPRVARRTPPRRRCPSPSAASRRACPIPRVIVGPPRRAGESLRPEGHGVAPRPAPPGRGSGLRPGRHACRDYAVTGRGCPPASARRARRVNGHHVRPDAPCRSRPPCGRPRRAGGVRGGVTSETGVGGPRGRRPRPPGRHRPRARRDRRAHHPREGRPGRGGLGRLPRRDAVDGPGRRVSQFSGTDGQGAVPQPAAGPSLSAERGASFAESCIRKAVAERGLTPGLVGLADTKAEDEPREKPRLRNL